MFRLNGQKFIRIKIVCLRKRLEDWLNRLKIAIAKYIKSKL